MKGRSPTVTKAELETVLAVLDWQPARFEFEPETEDEPECQEQWVWQKNGVGRLTLTMEGDLVEVARLVSLQRLEAYATTIFGPTAEQLRALALDLRDGSKLSARKLPEW